jgi:hypothetical protein
MGLKYQQPNRTLLWQKQIVSLVANFIPQTGVEDIEELKMSVYPNPTTGIVHFLEFKKYGA